MEYVEGSWVKEFPAAITISDQGGVVLEMNDRAEIVFEDDGGRALIGKNMLDCHPDPARGVLERLMEECRNNVYTIEKDGIKKLIYQTPWFKDGKYAGFVEMAIEIPFDMPHFIRS